MDIKGEIHLCVVSFETNFEMVKLDKNEANRCNDFFSIHIIWYAFVALFKNSIDMNHADCYCSVFYFSIHLYSIVYVIKAFTRIDKFIDSNRKTRDICFKLTHSIIKYINRFHSVSIYFINVRTFVFLFIRKKLLCFAIKFCFFSSFQLVNIFRWITFDVKYHRMLIAMKHAFNDVN